MMISFYRATTMLVLLVVLSGCSWIGKGEPEYVASVEHEPLKIPEGLDRPQGTTPPVMIASPNMRKPAGDELEPLPPRVASTAGKTATDVFLAWSAEGAYLFVKDTPESVARRLRYAIENSGMTMLERDDSGSHKFHYKQKMPENEGVFSSMAFWRDQPKDYSGTFMTRLQEDGEDTRVYLLFGNGETVDTAGTEHILGIFMERLG